MKFAYIVYMELRSIRKTIKYLEEFIIKPYQADIILCCQKKFDDDEERADLFKNPRIRILYDKIDPKLFYGESNIINLYDSANWNNYNNQQVYINLRKIWDCVKDIYTEYDYYIMTRVDSQIIFPYPDKELFEIAEPGIYTFDTDYCRTWGGYASGVFIHKNFIEAYLNKYYNVFKYGNVQEINNNNRQLNQEFFANYCLLKSGLKWKYIKNINLFFTTETLNDYTTWSIPSIHTTYGVICKYPDQCTETFNNYRLWESGKRWKYNNETFYLE